MRALPFAAILAVCACDGGSVSETLVPTSFHGHDGELRGGCSLAPSPSFADERGGGVFIDVGGRVVRLRIDGSGYEVESHPGNLVSPGPATAAFPMGAFSSVVATSKGLFVAENGWLIEPPWRDVLTSAGNYRRHRARSQRRGVARPREGGLF